MTPATVNWIPGTPVSPAVAKQLSDAAATHGLSPATLAAAVAAIVVSRCMAARGCLVELSGRGAIDVTPARTALEVAQEIRALPAGPVEGRVALRSDADDSYDFALTARGQSLQLDCRCKSGRSAQPVNGWLAAFGPAAAAVAADPRQPAGQLPLTTGSQHDELLLLGIGPPSTPVEGLIEGIVRHAVKTPAARALRVEGRDTTYAELKLASSRIAAALREWGIGPDRRVGLLMDRSEWLPIAALAVLSAGGAYVPLSYDWPEKRNAFVCADAEVELVLTTEALRTEVPGDIRQVRSIEDAVRRVPTGATELADGAGPEAAAYVLYTSGTTGRPKGVVVERGSLAEFVRSTVQLYGLSAADRCLQYATPTFDVFTHETLCALSAGASLHIASDDQRRDPGELTSLLREDHITFADLPPGVACLLEPDELPELRLLSMGGEALPQSLVDAWAKNGRRVVNSYGPTEATIAVTAAFCDSDRCGGPPIGRPLPNQRVYVLDERRRPVPAGAPGELYVAGTQLARGYVSRLDEQERRFVPDPLIPGERMFRTGDLARWNPDGELEFLGRADRQIKVSGMRVELEEVEAVLREVPGVTQAAAVAARGPVAGVNLHAYVVLDDEDQSADDVEAVASTWLPPHAVPQVKEVEALPLNPHGKVDERVLESVAESS